MESNLDKAIKNTDEALEVIAGLRLDEGKLAKYAHTAWSGWIKYMFSKMERQHNGDWWIPKWAYERWTRQANTKYEDLPEDEKESDRDEAKAIIKLQEGKG